MNAIFQFYVGNNKPAASLQPDIVTAIDRFVRPEWITGPTLAIWISRLSRSATDAPWAVIVWPHDYPVSGELAELRYVRRNMRLSSFFNLRNNEFAAPTTATVSIMCVRRKVILEDMVQRSSLLDSAWSMLKDRSPYRKWLCLCEGPERTFTPEDIQADAVRYQKAMARAPHVKSGLEAYTGNPVMQFQLETIMAASASRRYGQAARILARFCEKVPNNAWLWNWLGHLHREARNREAALAAYDRALSLVPDWPEVRWGIAQTRWLEAPVSAVPALDDLLAVDPFDERYLNLRTSHYRSGIAPAEYDRAELLLRRYVALQPDAGHAWGALGTLFCFQQRFEAAIPCLRRAVLLCPASPRYWNNLAFAQATLGMNLSAAEYASCRALDLNHTSPSSWDTLGVIAMKYGRFADAKSAFQTALRFAPTAADTRENLEKACRHLQAMNPMKDDI